MARDIKKLEYYDLPNPQVLDLASDFYDAAIVLSNLAPGSGVMRAEIVNAVLSAELMLKSICAERVTFDDPDSGEPYIVHAKALIHEHDLAKLLNAAQKRLLEHGLSFSEEFLAEHETNIKTIKDYFIDVRYGYEKGHAIDYKTLWSFVSDLKREVEILPMRSFRSISK